jgi:hypothetical protein
LLSNVYTNPGVQYNLHELLTNKVIRPLEGDLFQLAKRGVVEALESQELRQAGAEAAAKAITSNRELISKLALEFLGSATMDSIISKQVSSLLRSE